MCGILGTINRPFGKRTLDLIRHRGPDDSAIARVSIGRRLVTLGHRRLSILFSSEIRTLREFVDDSMDPASLAELLRLRYLPAPDTLFKKIRKVRPGHIVEVDLSGAQLSFREYPFTAPSDEVAVQSRSEAIE